MDTAAPTLTQHDQRVATARARIAREMEDHTHVQKNGGRTFQRDYFRSDYELPLATSSKARVTVARHLGMVIFLVTVATIFAVGALALRVSDGLAAVAVIATAVAGGTAGVTTEPYRLRAMFRPAFSVSAQMEYAYYRARAAVAKQRTTRPGALALLADFDTVYPGFQELVREFDSLTAQIQRERSWVNEEAPGADAGTFARRDQVQGDMYDVLAQVMAASWALRDTPATASSLAPAKKTPVPTVLSDGAQEQMREALVRIAAASA